MLYGLGSHTDWLVELTLWHQVTSVWVPRLSSFPRVKSSASYPLSQNFLTSTMGLKNIHLVELGENCGLSAKIHLECSALPEDLIRRALIITMCWAWCQHVCGGIETRSYWTWVLWLNIMWQHRCFDLVPCGLTSLLLATQQWKGTVSEAISDGFSACDLGIKKSPRELRSAM